MAYFATDPALEYNQQGYKPKSLGEILGGMGNPNEPSMKNFGNWFLGSGAGGGPSPAEGVLGLSNVLTQGNSSKALMAQNRNRQIAQMLAGGRQGNIVDRYTGNTAPTGPQPIKTKKVTTEEHHFPEGNTPSVEAGPPATPVGTNAPTPSRVNSMQYGSTLSDMLSGGSRPTQGDTATAPSVAPVTEPTAPVEAATPAPYVQNLNEGYGGDIAGMAMAGTPTDKMVSDLLTHIPQMETAKGKMMEEHRKMLMHPYEVEKTQAEIRKIGAEAVNLTPAGKRAISYAEHLGESEGKQAAINEDAKNYDTGPRSIINPGFVKHGLVPPGAKTVGDLKRMGIYDKMHQDYTALEGRHISGKYTVAAAHARAGGDIAAAKLGVEYQKLANASMIANSNAAAKIIATTFSTLKPDGTQMNENEINNARIMSRGKSPRTPIEEGLLEDYRAGEALSSEANKHYIENAPNAPATTKGKERRGAAGKGTTEEAPRPGTTGTAKKDMQITVGGRTFKVPKGKEYKVTNNEVLVR